MKCNFCHKIVKNVIPNDETLNTDHVFSAAGCSRISLDRHATIKKEKEMSPRKWYILLLYRGANGTNIEDSDDHRGC